MGMFTQSRLAGLSEDFVVEANEAYKGAAGAYRAMTEGYQNSYAVFESCIGLDFMEAAVVNESASAEEFEIVQEGFAGDFFNKIKEFFKKLIEKIKGIVSSFITKLTGTFCKDNKAFVNKHKGDVLKKDLSKMKYKWMPERSNNLTQVRPCTSQLSKAYNDILSNKGNIDFWTSDADKSHATVTSKRFVKEEEDLRENVYLEYDLGTCCGKNNTRVELGEFSQELHEYCFDDEEEFEGFSETGAPSIIEIMSELVSGKKTTSNLEKAKKEAEKICKERIKDIENFQKTVTKASPSRDEKTNTVLQEINRRLNLCMTAATQIQTLVTKVFASVLDEYKKYLARCKKVFVQAAAYRPKSTNEDTILAVALGESAEYEVCELFDNFVSEY